MPGFAVRRRTVVAQLLRGVVVCLCVVVRLSAATFTVINTLDSGGGSLRQALVDANNASGPHTIRFQVPGSGVHTITPLAALPPLLEPILIDGTTQPGYTGRPLIELNGASAANSAGLRLLAGNCTVCGLVINRFGASGLQIEGSGDNTVRNCFLGTDSSGTLARPNAFEGLWIYNSFRNTIGGTNAGEANLISGNSDSGVYIQNGGGNWLAGNLIGVTLGGSTALSNRNNGIVLYSSSENIIGGSLPAARNVISGNGASGIYLLGTGASLNRIQGNYIGVSSSGSASLANVADGVTVAGGVNNLLGGSSPGEGNLVSGNRKAGIAISGSGTSRNAILGNLVGTSAGGAARIGNGYAGIWLSGTVSNRIGESLVAGSNVISGNGQDGVLLGTNAAWNSVCGNFIGLNATGAAALSNGYSGISITAADSNTIGGYNASARNVISGNALYGVYLAAGSTGNALLGNLIGPDPTGTRALPNGRSGIRIESAGNRVGPENTISGNTYDGVVLTGGSSSNNIVQGNRLGTTLSGAAALPNGRAGVGISAAPRNTIGGSANGMGNTISANRDAGIYLLEPGATGNQIVGNRIGTDSAGNFALGNVYEGIYLENAMGNVIGSSLPSGANLISGNHTRGIFLTNASWNWIQGNWIGTAGDGVSPVPNLFHNLEAEAGATNNTVLANHIAFAPAPYCGVRVRNGSANNRLDGNSIFGNGALGIDLGAAGVAANDPCDADAGANNLQNFPTASEAISGSGTVVRGSLNSTAGTTFTLQFFASPVCDSSGSGEGQIYLGQQTVVTGAACQNNFSSYMPASVPPGWFITATATDPAGNTSEFSACVPVTPAPALTMTRVGSDVVLSWTNTPRGFVLSQTDSLSPPNWVAVTNTPVLINNTFGISIPLSVTGTRFYGLVLEN